MFITDIKRVIDQVSRDINGMTGSVKPDKELCK